MEQTNTRWLFILLLMSLISVLFCPPARAEASWLKYFRKDSLINTYKRCYAVIDDSLWVGTYGDGILVKTDGKTRRLTPQSTRSAADLNDGLISENINSITFDEKAQRVWAATPSGVSCCSLSGGDWLRYTTKEGLPNDAVRDIAVDGHGVVWAATASGLAAFDGERFNAISGSEGLSIHSIKAEGDSIWVGTVGGSVRRYSNGLWRTYSLYE